MDWCSNHGRKYVSRQKIFLVFPKLIREENEVTKFTSDIMLHTM